LEIRVKNTLLIFLARSRKIEIDPERPQTFFWAASSQPFGHDQLLPLLRETSRFYFANFASKAVVAAFVFLAVIPVGNLLPFRNSFSPPGICNEF
jgi:hypothetical protein